jgi:hypothetical protein
MKTNIKKIFSAVMLLLLLTSCEKLVPMRQAIYVRNNSSQTIYYYAEYILPDTMLSVNKPRWLKEIAPGGIREFYDNEVNDKEFKRLDSGERITVFILDKNVVDTYEWEYIRENNMVLRRYEFLIKELYADNGRNVIYPPDERMKDIKMYPPYGE